MSNSTETLPNSTCLLIKHSISDSLEFERRIKMLIELTDEKLMQCDGGKTPYQLTVEALRKWLELMNSRR